jgi:hypothetical protein
MPAAGMDIPAVLVLDAFMLDNSPDLRPVVARLFPNGTNGSGRANTIPRWPPDLFAFAAEVAEQYGIYAQLPFTCGWLEDTYLFKDEYLDEISRLCQRWHALGKPPPEAVRAWNRLVGRGKSPVRTHWHQDVMLLMVLSDAVSEGMGFELDETSPQNYARVVFAQMLLLQKGMKSRILTNLPQSLCWMVPSSEVCVQPKTNTPKVGCTLRSLSHHLALLPSTGVVSTGWVYAAPPNSPPNLNMLLIPFPYHIDAGDFAPTLSRVDPQNAYFCVKQGWLKNGDQKVSAQDVADFLTALIDAAQREADTVHALVLPELALDGTDVDQIARSLAITKPKLELLISGVLDEAGENLTRNSAYMARLLGGDVVQSWHQAKHHRWRLEANQIRRYHLGFVLDPEQVWWEQIDVSNRACSFTVVRQGASIATLVCEDLARSDPVMPAINSVGPNLLVALLMDGPQWEKRWPGRYATVLADDPGTSVLTLTSIGMINRSTNPGQAPGRQIALWKQAGDVAQELTLPAGEHALLLSLTMAPDSQTTLDRRCDDGTARQFRLSGVRAIRLSQQACPPWIRA